MENPITRYLEDVIAAEKSFETQLNGFAEEASQAAAKNLFRQHAIETKQQYEALETRLHALGGSTSTLKSFMAHIFNMSPKLAQIGHAQEERTAQDLMMAFAVENAEDAMYEGLIVAAMTAGDTDTAALAKQIQAQERETAEKVWSLIAPAAVVAFRAVQSERPSEAGDVIIRYLQDAEAAEENFEDALGSFSATGDQPEVRSLMAMMSSKAKTQHTRLRARLESLGATRSVAKSILAHLLAFTPVTAQTGHTESEKNSQHLMIVFAAAAAEMAMYESLAATAEEAGDQATAQLARQLQAEEKEDHKLAWQHLAKSAMNSSQEVVR
jgi:ferritin-like metal-binding protein YciE